MIKKILVAVDGSDHAAKAIAFGADIAAKYGAELLLVHVLLRQELPRDLQRIAEAEHLAAGDGRRTPPQQRRPAFRSPISGAISIWPTAMSR